MEKAFDSTGTTILPAQKPTAALAWLSGHSPATPSLCDLKEVLASPAVSILNLSTP